MDVPEVRAARIDLRVAELRLLAAQTAVKFGREQRTAWACVFDCNCWRGQLCGEAMVSVADDLRCPPRAARVRGRTQPLLV